MNPTDRVIDARDLPPCPLCRRLELWWNAEGHARCLHCDPPPRLRKKPLDNAPQRKP